ARPMIASRRVSSGMTDNAIRELIADRPPPPSSRRHWPGASSRHKVYGGLKQKGGIIGPLTNIAIPPREARGERARFHAVTASRITSTTISGAVTRGV